MSIKETEIFGEILASDKLGAYQDFSYNLMNALGNDDPSYIWEQLKWNPWFAMGIYDEIEEKDSTIFSCLDARKTNVLSYDQNVLPASDKRQDKKIAEFVEETLRDFFGNSNTLDEADESPFDSFLYEALDAIGRGLSIGEIIYGEASDRIFVKEVKFKPQHLFAFGETQFSPYSTASMLYPQTGRLHLRQGVLATAFPLGSELPEQKFFVFSYRPRYGNRWGSPVLRKVFWQSWIKRNSIKQWLRYQEKGSGVVIARYNDGAAEGEMKNAQDAATAVQEESAVAIPKKFLLEVHEMVRNIGSSHKELVDGFCNAEITKAILGGTLTSRGSDGGGSRALGEVHERKESRISETDAKALMAAVNRNIIRPIVFYNFGPNAKCPTWKIEYEPQENLDSKAKRYATVRKEIGLELSKQQVREDLDLEEPRDEADTLGGETQTKPEETQDPLDAKTLEFAEKKKILVGSGDKSNSKTERFRRLRPSMIQFSDE